MLFSSSSCPWPGFQDLPAARLLEPEQSPDWAVLTILTDNPPSIHTHHLTFWEAQAPEAEARHPLSPAEVPENQQQNL